MSLKSPSLFPLQLNMASATEESNEKHTGPWSEVCQRDGIHATPLTPYIDQVRALGTSCTLSVLCVPVLYPTCPMCACTVPNLPYVCLYCTQPALCVPVLYPTCPMCACTVPNLPYVWLYCTQPALCVPVLYPLHPMCVHIVPNSIHTYLCASVIPYSTLHVPE